jgi:starch synthase (maltosyl-transferring)
MPVGFEFGFTRRIDVVHTRATDWETPQAELSGFVTRVNSTRRRVPGLAGEDVAAVTPLDAPALVLRANDAVAWVAVNKDLESPHDVQLPAAARGRRVWRICRDAAPEGEDAGSTLHLAPAEVAYVG